MSSAILYAPPKRADRLVVVDEQVLVAAARAPPGREAGRRGRDRAAAGAAAARRQREPHLFLPDEHALVGCTLEVRDALDRARVLAKLLVQLDAGPLADFEIGRAQEAHRPAARARRRMVGVVVASAKWLGVGTVVAA